MVIELFRPELADRIEGFIDKMESYLETKILHYMSRNRQEGALLRIFDRLYIFIILSTLVFVSWAIPILLTKSSFLQLNPLLFGGLTLLSIWLVWQMILLSGVVHFFLSFLNKLTKGKALGAFGFILTLIGMTCELYQFSDMVINWPF